MQSGSHYADSYTLGTALRPYRDHTSLFALGLAAFALGLSLVLFFQSFKDKPACPCRPDHGHHGAVIGEKVQ